MLAESQASAEARCRQLVSRTALRWYLLVFVSLAVVGWGLEVAGRSDRFDLTIDYSAFFHPTEDYIDHAAYGDLTDLAARTVPLSAAGLRREGEVPFPYPPAAAFLFYFFNHVAPNAVAAYFAVLVLFGVVAVMLVARGFGRMQPLAWVVLTATAILGSPQIFCANRANLELFVSATSAAGLALFLGGFGWAAAVVLGLAMCIKPFPALLLLLFVWRRQWAQAALAVAVCVVVSVVALHQLGPDVQTAWHWVRLCWGDYFVRQVVTMNILQEMRTDHSLMDAVKMGIWQFGGKLDVVDVRMTAGYFTGPLWMRLDLWVRFFQALAVLAVGWAWWRFAKRPVLNQVFALVILMLLLPYVSSEYTLLLLYLPCAVLLRWMSRNALRLSMRQGVLLALMLAMLFAPLNLLGPYEGLAKTGLLLGLLRFVTVVPLETTFVD